MINFIFFEGNVIKSQYIRGDANDKHIQWLTQSPAKISTQERTLMETISKVFSLYISLEKAIFLNKKIR